MNEGNTVLWSTLDAICASKDYHTAQIVTQLERERHERSSRAIDLARIRERYEEMRCQHEPLAGMLKSIGLECGAADFEPTRKMVMKAARFIVFGQRDS